MKKDKKVEMINQSGPLGFVMFVAWFGALIYFVNQAHGFWEVILAFLKACVWPALVMYRALDLLAM